MTSNLIGPALQISSGSLLKNLVFNYQQARSFFGYLRIAFNQVDESRLREIGPDRLCAEW